MSASTDPIADFLTRLRNASSARKSEFTAPYSKMKSEIARILKAEGYISDFELDSTGKHPQLKVKTKFTNKTPAFVGIKRVSRPGLRRYVGSQEIPRVLGGMGIAVLSTSKGILSGHEARKQKLGGELLAYIW
jgi:small subunit ribosomal protein S8